MKKKNIPVATRQTTDETIEKIHMLSMFVISELKRIIIQEYENSNRVPTEGDKVTSLLSMTLGFEVVLSQNVIKAMRDSFPKADSHSNVGAS